MRDRAGLEAASGQGRARPVRRPVWFMLRAGALAGAISAGVAASAATDERPHANVIEFVNDTPQKVMFIYAHMENVTDWEDDLLGEDVLEPGQSFKVDLDLGPGRCEYEIMVHLADKQRLHYWPFDACKQTTLHISMDDLDPAFGPAP